MNKLFLSAGQLAFVIVVPIVVVSLIALAIYFPFRNKKMKTDFRYFYYKKIYRVTLDNDYYLINNFLFKIDDHHMGKVDHILFADKYIYIISDFYFDGDIEGKENDTSIIFINKLGKKQYVDNILNDNKKIMNKLSLVTGVNTSLMIGICVINDNCKCGIETTSKNQYIIQSKRFKELLKAIESRPIANINSEQLADAVKAIDKLNRKKKLQSGK